MIAETMNPPDSARSLWMTSLLLVAVIILMAYGVFQNIQLNRSYKREVEHNKQIATLIAENRRLRGNCPTGPTPSGTLVSNQPRR